MSVLTLRPRLLAAALAAATATGVTAAALEAQSTPAPPAPPQGASFAPGSASDECFAFAFGGWTPPLDARAAGHRSGIRADTMPQAPNGREWAMRLETQRDTTLMLFPPWWPAGVAIRVPRSAEAASDTVRGTAVALVADGRLTTPKAAVRLWRVPCGKRQAAGRAGPPGLR